MIRNEHSKEKPNDSSNLPKDQRTRNDNLRPRQIRGNTTLPTRDSNTDAKKRNSSYKRFRSDTSTKPRISQVTRKRYPKTPVLNNDTRKSSISGDKIIADTESNGTTERVDLHLNLGEKEFTRTLDFYGIRWWHRPRSYAVRWQGDRPIEQFTPQFYLSEFNLWVEFSISNRAPLAQKFEKLRQIGELYPEINAKLLYSTDCRYLAQKYAIRKIGRGQLANIDHVLYSTNQIHERVLNLGRQISKDYRGLEPLLVGVLPGTICFLADLIREIALPLKHDYISLTSPSSGKSSVNITRSPTERIAGRHVILLTDVVDTGLSGWTMYNYLSKKRPASIEICTLFDKPARRIVDLPIRFVGFEIPDAFLAGYGIEYSDNYSNLPFVGVLRSEV